MNTFSSHKYLFLRYIFYVQRYLFLIAIFIIIYCTIFSIYIYSKLLLLGIVEKFDDIYNYLSHNNIFNKLNIWELTSVIIFELLVIYFVMLSYKKALTKMIFKLYKYKIIKTKLKRISWIKSIIYCICVGIVASILLQIVFVFHEKPTLLNFNLTKVYISWIILWIIFEYPKYYLTIESKTIRS